jgi:hypothetical protein
MKNDLLDEIIEFETTPGPWTVEPHPDTEGAYIVKEARYEQQIWGPDGYDISDEEGDRRDLIVERRDASNVRLIQAAPQLFEALKNLLLLQDTGRKKAIETFMSIKSIGPTSKRSSSSTGKRGAGMVARTLLAEAILAEYCRFKGEPLDSYETVITDMMTDLMHLARNNDLDGFDLSRMAQMHFLVEEETDSQSEV